MVEKVSKHCEKFPFGKGKPFEMFRESFYSGVGTTEIFLFSFRWELK